MGTIRVVWGTASAPTEMSSYDAALAEAGIENYNLVSVSSVIPSGAHVERVGTAPDLGPVGERLTVVEGRVTVEEGPAAAGLAWATTEEGTGLFYEASGREAETVREEVHDGLRVGMSLRDWEFVDEGREVVEADTGDGYTTALVLAVYGRSTPLL
ncbi:pyruvoyl-dependent arginine decarboxylase [Halomarina oriensis]|uniref:arginine decarboxylase n=1 Tax=Halomarina oriensis TaxID=671145 RepID=A0A6B0GIK3_9EURY|nr:pyruvoyl-dependent arginine decarboxylase [Halomarina oriensis]MWG33697.1 pyruvoyl-dependent arginine decarboxylase [Halomarina oriensis]